MSELKKGEKVKLIHGGEVTVKRKLGRGGQGIVYLVDYEGKEFALKWYMKDEGDLFYRNLQHNAQTPAPSGSFLLPLHVTERMKDSFCYVMKLRPKEYAELGDFFTAKARFSSFDAILNAALSICNGFNRLHTSGYCYQDLNEGNFLSIPRPVTCLSVTMTTWRPIIRIPASRKITLYGTRGGERRYAQH